MTARQPQDSSLKAAISVAEMARMVGLSRNHFWVLAKRGVFPLPLYSVTNKRPFYDLEAQEVCLRVRSTNIGVDGGFFMFNAARKNETTAPSPAATSQNGKRSKPSERTVGLMKALKHLGLEVTAQQVESAVVAVYPQGLPAEDGAAIRALYLHCKKAVG
jgi:hypothetical protein